MRRARSGRLGVAAPATASSAPAAAPGRRPRPQPAAASAGPRRSQLPPPRHGAALTRAAASPPRRGRRRHRARASRSWCRSAIPTSSCAAGPGRGYPIFFVAPRNDWIEIELRHTDWFRIRTEDNKVGWVSRQQLETTLTAAGSTKSFRDVLLDDYLSRKVQLGAAWGHFKSEPMLKLWTSYRFSDTLEPRGHDRPGARRLLGHRHLARRHPDRAVVGPSHLAVLRRRRRQVQELPQPRA